MLKLSHSKSIVWKSDICSLTLAVSTEIIDDLYRDRELSKV